jgi:hypothetical protein
LKPNAMGLTTKTTGLVNLNEYHWIWWNGMKEKDDGKRFWFHYWTKKTKHAEENKIKR